MMIVDVALTHVVATQQELFAPAIPNRESKIAQQMRGTSLTPFFVGAHHQRAVGHLAEVGRGDAERHGQFFAIIEPDVGDQGCVSGGVVKRLRLELILSVYPHQAVTEADRAGDNMRAPVRPAVDKRVAHALQLARRCAIAVETQNPKNRAHGFPAIESLTYGFVDTT